MNAGGMNGNLKQFLACQYTDAKADLMTSFMERAIVLTLQSGYWAMINLPSWMFLSSFESLRLKLLCSQKLGSLVHLGRGIFGSDFGTVAFAFQNRVPSENAVGIYRRLFDKHVEVRSPERIQELFLNTHYGWYRQSQRQMTKVPGAPIAYWIKSIELFSGTKIGDLFYSGGRNKTHDNNKFLRFIWEVGKEGDRWKLYCNGGEFRKYYGNEFHLVDWSDGARSFYDSHGGLCNQKFWDKEGLTWSLITAAITSFRIKQSRCLYSSGSPTIFNENYVCDNKALGLLNSKVTRYFLSAINPTVNTTVNDVFSLPYPHEKIDKKVGINTETCIELSSRDWDSYETSWDFTSLPLLNPDYQQPNLKATYQKLRAHWLEMTLEMQRLEEENNRIFIDAYGLQDELTPEVPLNEITLTCNPHYRYGNGKTEEELEALLLADTMRELVSYAVGCMFGRYALDKPGLILANQGETLSDYLKQIPEPSFPADDDNVIPMLDGDWFTDDITERFRQFLRVAFGEEHYEENLKFVEQALNVKGKREYTLRDYFLGEFYNDHIKRYKKRPIYWLFSSPKGSFNALIYMHRYRPDTVSVVLNDYLREFRTKLTAHKSHLEAVSISASAGSAEKTKALKEIDKINKMIAELEEYEREVLYPLATQQIDIDLDDALKPTTPNSVPH